MPAVKPLPFEPYLFVQDSQYLFVQIASYINLFVCWFIFSLNLKIPFLHPNLLLVFSEKWKIVVEFCCKKIWNWKQDLTFLGLVDCLAVGCWLVLVLPLPSKKVKVPMSGWRLCQMTLKSPDTLLDTNWYFDLDEKWISTANNSYYFLLVIILPPSFAKHL